MSRLSSEFLSLTRFGYRMLYVLYCKLDGTTTTAFKVIVYSSQEVFSLKYCVRFQVVLRSHQWHFTKCNQSQM